MRRRRRPKKSGHTPLRMTSMMDILTVLLLFLLKSFVVDPEVVTPASGLTLPESSSQETPEESVVIAIIGDSITLGDEVVAYIDDGDADSLLIDSLANVLAATLEQQRELDRLRGESEDNVAKITIQGDQDMPFQHLQRLMYTCNQAGYDDISLAVLKAA